MDFPDDCQNIIFTEKLVEDLLDRLYWMGARRIYWNFYPSNQWDWYGQNNLKAKETIKNLGDPIAVGCRFAHKRGMEFYATIKPYETGRSHSNPRNTLKTFESIPGKPPDPTPHRKRPFAILPSIAGDYVVDPWVQDHPEMRVKCRTVDKTTEVVNIPIRRIQLRQKDMNPIRIKANNLQIWTSNKNHGYKKKNVLFDVIESIEICPRDVIDMNGLLVTKKGDSVRTLELTGLNLGEPFIAITTDFDDDCGVFANTALEMVRVFGPDDKQLPVMVASHKAVWRPQRNLRSDDLEYDNGLGDILICLDVTNSRPISPDGVPYHHEINESSHFTRDGVIAVARARQEYVSGSLCEAYPEVRNYWMSWVDQCIAAGIDGLDVRISNHSCWVNTPNIYGFNEPVVAEYERQYGINPDMHAYDTEKIGAIRGDFFDAFLGEVKVRLSSASKKMSVNCEMESFRMDSCQARWRTRPGNIIFNWRSWLRSELIDEVTLLCRGWDPGRMLQDPLAHEMLEIAKQASVPVHISNPVRRGHNISDAEKLEYSYNDRRLAGYCFYETSAMYDTAQSVDSNDRLNFRAGLLEEIRERVQKLEIINDSR